MSDNTGTEVEKATKPRRRASNFCLEQLIDDQPSGETVRCWRLIKDGFISPEAAIQHIEKSKLIGTYRVIRVASAEYTAALITPEPVITIKKLKKA